MQTTTRNRLLVIGIGDDGEQSLLPRVREKLNDADILYGSERQLALVSAETFAGERRVLPRPLQKFLCDINQLNEACSVAVLASGDPLFYGIGSTLIRALGRDRVEVWPALSSVQLAFARAGEAWQQARLLSVHGRPLTGLAQRVHGAKSVALLTDGIHTPNAIAKYLLHFEMTEYDMFVAERLGSPEETCAWYSLAEAADAVFDPLNVVILSRRADASAPSFHLGVDDAKFAQRKPDRGLITKREVRIVSLSELRLRAGDVLWDIGACTGSVGIEAILQQPEVEVYAVEKNAEDLENLRVNQITFRTDFVAVHAKAPAGLDQFPDPDAVFIGGSGGELRELLHLCATRLKPGGRIVVNAATLETLATAHQTLLELGFAVSVTMLQTARSKPILQFTRLEGMNPVYLVSAMRKEAGDGA